MGLPVYNVTGYIPSTDTPVYPLSIFAIIFPLLAFPAWILCLAPLVWHFRQGNIAAGSLITWICLYNFFNSINALIWPRDNILEWWDGAVWCDINVRIQVGSTVALAASTACVTRKLARVLDTSNITVSSSRKSKVTAMVWEVIWCWGFPVLLIPVYYVVQPVRYMIYGIVGCMSAYDTSWPSIVLSNMWGPITMGVAAYWAGMSPLSDPSSSDFINANRVTRSTDLPSLPLPPRIPPPRRCTQHHILALHTSLHPIAPSHRLIRHVLALPAHRARLRSHRPLRLERRTRPH
jgi:hypothetical protein